MSLCFGLAVPVNGSLQRYVAGKTVVVQKSNKRLNPKAQSSVLSYNKSSEIFRYSKGFKGLFLRNRYRQRLQLQVLAENSILLNQNLLKIT